MNQKRVSVKLVALVFFLTILFHAPAPIAGQEVSRHPFSIPDMFNQEAAVSDPDGMQKYSADLLDLLVPDVAKGIDVSADASRLAQAEQVARAGKDKLVPELSVVQAFNWLISRIGAPPTFRASEESLHDFRQHAAETKAFPALFSAGRNGANCTPGEAVFLLYLLIEEDGNLSVQNLDLARRLAAGNVAPEEARAVAVVRTAPAEGHLSGIYSAYAAHHRHQATGALLHNLTAELGY